jgi:lycopene epsilon-cyclase
MLFQASKKDDQQPSLLNVLSPFKVEQLTADVAVVGCGPAGLALAAELAAQGLLVALIGKEEEVARGH